MLTINGEAAAVQGLTLLEYLLQAGYKPQNVAVERNLAIVPQTAWADTVLEDGDVVEIVTFVGGG